MGQAQDDFFNNNEPTTETVQQEVEKIKLGEKEYTQDELKQLVGLGEIGREAEQKYKTRIDRVWPQFQSVINEKKALEEKLSKIESERQTQHQKELEERLKQVQNTQQTTQTQQANGQQQQTVPQLTAEQVREIALKQAEDLGIGPQSIRKIINETLQGQQLINDITATIDSAQEEGWIKTNEPVTVEDVLAHMQETGIRNPLKALRDMREDAYIEVQAEKRASIKKPSGLPTVSSSTAGSKQPAPVRITNDNLEQMLNDAIREAF